jgi:mycofactocin system glycosyltransferase
VLAGGAPYRIMRLSGEGMRALDVLLAGGRGATEQARALGGRLVAAGLAAPVPGDAVPVPPLTVIVPARDRVPALGRCLAALGDAAPVLVVDDGSEDPEAVAAASRAHGACVVRRPESGGPGAARNTGLEHVDTELVAFLDSDCIPSPGWVERSARHFADPRVGAVAPRIRPLAPGTAAGRYAASRSPLDLGDQPAEVAPGRPVPYVPTAALLVRRDALRAAAPARGSPAAAVPARGSPPAPFDEALRYGEDVDVVWRIRDAGWTVRYDPAVSVGHEEPIGWRALLVRRWRYGTSAATLSARHRGRLAPLVLRPHPSIALGLLLGRRRLAALAAAALPPLLALPELRRAGLPLAAVPALGISGTWQTLLGTSRAAITLAAPALAAGLLDRRTRPAAALLLLAAPLHEYGVRRPPLDPVRWTAASLADDIAYGAGVWWGCARGRTVAPLVPRRRPIR